MAKQAVERSAQLQRPGYFHGERIGAHGAIAVGGSEHKTAGAVGPGFGSGALQTRQRRRCLPLHPQRSAVCRHPEACRIACAEVLVACKLQDRCGIHFIRNHQRIGPGTASAIALLPEGNQTKREAAGIGKRAHRVHHRGGIAFAKIPAYAGRRIVFGDASEVYRAAGAEAVDRFAAAQVRVHLSIGCHPHAEFRKVVVLDAHWRNTETK